MHMHINDSMHVFERRFLMQFTYQFMRNLFLGSVCQHAEKLESKSLGSFLNLWKPFEHKHGGRQKSERNKS
jgi:hypothetical protein